MLHDGRQCDREWPRQIADRQIGLLAELRQQRPSRRVGEGREGAVESVVLILNHMV